MAEADWTELTNALSSSDVSRGVSTAFTRPLHSVPASNAYVFGFRSLNATATGVAAFYYDGDFSMPTVGKGGTIAGAMKKYSSAAGYSPFFGLILDKDPSANGYFVCLTDGTSYKIGLKKGSPSGGFSESDSGMLRLSDDSFTASGDAAASFFDLQLSVLVNPHGEVHLRVRRNPLTGSNGVDNRSFAAIDGMDDYIDDSLGALSGTLPYTTGFYFVKGMYVQNTSGCLALYDHFELAEQTSP